MRGQAAGHFLDLIMHAVVKRRRATHHVALDIAATTEGSEVHFVDAADGPFYISFQNPVQLEILAIGNPQGAVSHLVAQVQFSQQLIAVQPAGRDF